MPPSRMPVLAAMGKCRAGVPPAGRRVDRGLFLVLRQAGALEIQSGDLAFQFANGPVAADAFDFIEGALERVVDCEQFDEMGEGKPVHQQIRSDAQFGNRRFPRVQLGRASVGGREFKKEGFGNR